MGLDKGNYLGNLVEQIHIFNLSETKPERKVFDFNFPAQHNHVKSLSLN